MSMSSEIKQEISATDPPELSQAPANVPDIVRIGALPTNTQMSVDTDINEPVVKSQSFCRFVLENKGLLHSNSKIVFNMAQTDIDTFMPMGISAASVIQRAVLRVGTKTINSTEDFAHYEAYRSTFISGENALEREMITTGKSINFGFEYDKESDTEAESIRLDVGREIDRVNSDDTTFPDYQLLKNQREFQINLSSLFSFLKMNQLPLYLMREQVSIELHFTPLASTLASSERVSVRGGATDTGADIDIDLDSIKLISDHIFYPTEIMDAFARQNTNMTMSYMDYKLSKQTLTSTASASQINNIRNIGGAGKIVTKLIVSLSNASKSTNLLNEYNSRAGYSNAGLGNDSFSASLVSNVKYNGQFLYPIDVNNYARHFHNVQQAEGTQPFVPKACYSLEMDNLSTNEFEGRDVNHLAGRFFRQAYRMNKGERVNARGIELYHNYTKMHIHTYTQRVYLETAKFANLSNGVLVCYDA